MVREAEAHAEEDRRRKELVEIRNQADAAIYTAEKTLREAEGGLPADMKSNAEQAIAAVREAMAGEDIQRIRSATERLSQTMLQVAEAMAHANAGAAAGAGAGDAGQAGASDADVVDAEFEETDGTRRRAS
jgi:molecular chaperone DnaK